MTHSIKLLGLAGALALLVGAEASQAVAQVDMMAPEGRGALYSEPAPAPGRTPGPGGVTGAPGLGGVTGAPADSETQLTPPGLGGLCSVNGVMAPCDSVGRSQFNYGLPSNAATRCNVDSYFYNPGMGTYTAPGGGTYYCP